MKILNKIKKIFKKKEQSKVLYYSKPKKVVKKRKHIKISLEFLKHFEFLRKRYIPYLFILFTFFIIITIVLILGPFFRVKYIEIIKKDNITSMDIAYKALDSLRGKQMFKINELDIFNKLKDYQDNIQSVRLNLNLPSTIKVEIGSYEGIFNVVINEKDYILLKNGTLIPSNHNKDLRLLNIITNIDKNKFIEYKQVFEPKFLQKISTIIKKFEQNFLDTQIESLYYYETGREFHLKLGNQTLLIFSIDDSDSEDEQIEKLAIFNKDYFGINSGNFVYIDLRIGNKIFYCNIDNKEQCEKNLKGIYGF